MELYYNEQEKITPKKIDNIDLNLLATAQMNEYILATNDKPIIGTYALATCLGIIIYDEYGHYALGHILNDHDYILKQMVASMKNTSSLKVIITPGLYTNASKIYEVIAHLKSRDNFFYHDFEIEVKNLKNYLNKDFDSIEFAFDTRTLQFIKPNYDEYLRSEFRI